MDLDDLETKLNESEKKLMPQLNAKLPEVSVTLPRMDPASFGAQSGGYEPVGSGSVRETGVAEGEAPAAASKAAAAMAEGKADLAKQFIVPLTTQAATLGIAGAAATAGVSGVAMGVLSAITNHAGTSLYWKNRADKIFDVMSDTITKIKDKVGDSLEVVEEKAAVPLRKVVAEIETIIKEQKPAVDKAHMLEKTLGMDVPDPGDLKKPLDGLDKVLDEKVGNVQKGIPAQIDTIVQASTAGRIAMNKSSFALYVIAIPLGIMLLVNIGIAVAQGVLMAPSAPAAAETSRLLGDGSDTSKSLRGSLDPSDAASDVAGAAQKDIVAAMQPAFVQCALALLQVVLSFLASQKKMVCGFVNAAIGKFQNSINNKINDEIKEVLSKVFESGFGEVKEAANDFFPKFKELFAALKKADQAGAAMDALKSGELPGGIKAPW